MAAVTHDPETTLAWEKRHRPRAAVASLLGAIGLLVFYISGQRLESGGPSISGLDTLERADEPGRVETLPSLRVPEFQYLDDNMVLVLAMGVGAFIGFTGMAWAAGFLGVAARARTENVRRWLVYVPIIGGVVVGLAILLIQVSVAQLTSDFLDGPRTVRDATQPESGFRVFASLLYNVGSLMLAVGLVLTSLNAMRVGLLTKLFGYIGIIAGALLILVPHPIVQVFWLAGVGFLFLGRWPGGDPPAWRTGKAEPWPSPMSAAEARAARNRKPATEPAAGPKPRGSGRSKRKKRH